MQWMPLTPRRFSNSSQDHSADARGTRTVSNAVINDAEIVFQNNGAHWRISRITGQYSVDLSGTVASGYCVPGKEKKF